MKSIVFAAAMLCASVANAQALWVRVNQAYNPMPEIWYPPAYYYVPDVPVRCYRPYYRPYYDDSILVEHQLRNIRWDLEDLQRQSLYR